MCNNNQNPTTEESTLKCLIQDSKENKESMGSLIEMFMPLIIKASKTYFKEGSEDALNEGVEAFIKAVHRYDLDSKVPFPHYSKKAVYSHIRHYASREIGGGDLVSLDSPVKGCEDINLVDTISTGELIEDDFINRISCIEILNAVETLDYIEKEVFMRHYILEHPLTKIASDLDYSYRGIKYAKTRCLKLLQKELRLY
ncbi:MAG: sigma-70 family RNA polymerase sigma factor [Clostridium sp.]